MTGVIKSWLLCACDKGLVCWIYNTGWPQRRFPFQTVFFVDCGAVYRTLPKKKYLLLRNSATFLRVIEFLFSLSSVPPIRAYNVPPTRAYNVPPTRAYNAVRCFFSSRRWNPIRSESPGTDYRCVTRNGCLRHCTMMQWWQGRKPCAHTLSVDVL